jgi:hypothetical protein
VILSQTARNFQSLPPGDNGFQTGAMSECVSVVVLFELGGVKYRQVRGQHGAGGVESINLAGMLNGVPNVATSQIIVIPGFSRWGRHDLRRISRRVTKAAEAAQLTAVTTRLVTGIANALIDRQGRVTSA